MSELINNNTQRLENLAAFTIGLIRGENGKMLIDKYREYIDTVTPFEAMEAIDQMLRDGHTMEQVKTNVGKIINIFYRSLSTYPWERPDGRHFLHYLMVENREVEKVMNAFKKINKKLFIEKMEEPAALIMQIKSLLENLKKYELHYIKKENILFPYIERTFPGYRCLHIMWSFHDDFRQSMKDLEKLLQPEAVDMDLLNKEIGRLFFIVYPLIFREEQIVFPVAMRAIPENAWKEMLEQSFELGWYGEVQPQRKDILDAENSMLNGFIDLNTGFLTARQLVLLLNNLPIDITFVDENDEVRYFSGSKHRLFPRSKAIIGRKVQNCHPPESMHVVNEIIEAFKNGTRDNAEFWIEIKGRFIHIRYFALHNELGEYKGVIEVSQDATEIRGLQGERRLLEF